MRPRSNRIRSLVVTGLLAVLGTLLAGGIWTGLLIANLATTPTLPWAVGAMALLLWLAWQYLGGTWAPRRTSEARRHSLRANPISGQVFAQALLAGLLAIVALVGLWIVMFQLVRAPGNALPDFSRYPPLTVALVVVMASLVSSVAEEAGLRGYFQVALERELGGPAAIVISCLVLSPGHGLTQGFVWTTLLFYLFVDVTFSVTAYLTNSILPGILVHSLGLLIFFTVVWPNDATRRLVWEGGADAWFWIHLAQVIVFTPLAILAFRRLAQVTRHPGTVGARPILPSPDSIGP